MELVEVKDRKTEQLFLKVPKLLYRNDENWICPPDRVVKDIFDPRSNSFFGHGEAARWILKGDAGQLVGRVAAFINRKKAYNFEQPTGGMGFFECTHDRESAFRLFDQCRNWLESKGMQAMDGPINFGENDMFWGLLVEGFMPQSYGMNYNPPFYREFFESYGFRPYFEQISNHLDLRKPFPERFWKIAEWVMRRPGYRFEHFTIREKDKYIRDLKTIYDDAWQFHENFTPLKTEDILKTLDTAKAFLIEDFIWFVYDEGKPVAFLVMIPDVNQILRHFNGKINFFNKIRFYFMKSRKAITRSRITIMGVVPKHQRSGIESGIFWHLDKAMKRHPEYHEIELSWVGDFNPKMRALHESVGAFFAKKHITYRKLFSGESEGHRSTIIPCDTKAKAIGKES